MTVLKPFGERDSPMEAGTESDRGSGSGEWQVSGPVGCQVSGGRKVSTYENCKTGEVTIETTDWKAEWLAGWMAGWRRGRVTGWISDRMDDKLHGW